MVEKALGPQWKLVSRASGLIFAGTVLSVETVAQNSESPLPLVQLEFRVEHAIAGVKPGEIVTIREWAGAWDAHRPMHAGQHFLLFFYPPSSLGLTSLVGGPLGQFELDPAGRIIAAPSRDPTPLGPTHPSPAHTIPAPIHSTYPTLISWRQLQRAIRGAREE